jgi:GT2 family glycosyltransferase
MQFNRASLANKSTYLDKILTEEALLTKVLSEFAGQMPYRYEVMPRPWSPGGGATLFMVQVGESRYFLKVKHCSVTVESKLETEPAFLETPSLANEYRFLDRLARLPQSENVATVIRYMEDGGYGFLFVEYLDSFAGTVQALGARELVEAYTQIERTVRVLYDHGIVHTDIHENNILFRGQTPVLVDFEEAREYRQSVSFEESLDLIGANHYGDVGEMPSGHGFLPGYTCLKRLRQVFEKLVLQKLDRLIKECNFDSTCPFLTALDHGRDERIYQSIDVPGFSNEGQRPLFDSRIRQIAGIADTLFDRPYTHLDIGSNLGRFNLELAKQPQVRKSIGVEAYDKYVYLARVLAFLSDTANVEFFCAECGKDNLSDLLRNERIDLVTVYSVYHHIKNKSHFLEDLKRLNPTYIMFEMAVQEECYEGRSWQDEMASVCRELGMPHTKLLGCSEDYRRPVVLISKQDIMLDKPSPDIQGHPRVSVVLPTYNHLKFLPHAIQSLLLQTCHDFELIIVNDGSTDGTREFLDTLKDARIRVIHQANQRLPHALNAGFAAARGALLTWVSADNYCAPIFLEALVASLDAHPDAGLAYSAFAWIDEQDRITGVHRDQDFSYHNLLAQNPGNASFLYRRACLERVGDYDPTLEGAEDWDMWVRIVEQYPTVYVPEILYYYRAHDRSMTMQKREQVHRASCQTFRKAVARKKGDFALAELYPALALCTDQATATFHACLDFGTTLLRSPFSPVEMATQYLERAHAAAPDAPAALGNLAVAYGRAGYWDKALQMTGRLRGINHPAVRAIHDQVADAVRQQQSDLLRTTPVLVLTKSEVELFQKERQQQIVCAFTAQTKKDQIQPSEPARSAKQPRVSERQAVEPGGQSEPLVSVIVPTFNRLDTLLEAVTSVLNQTYKNLEVIVVNDSGADAENLVTFLNRDGRVTYIKHGKNRGLAAARNTGIGAARGKYIAYLDDDDKFYPDHVEILVRYLEGSDYKAAYTDAYRVHQVREGDRYVVHGKDVPYSADFNFAALLVFNYFPVLCMMHERACLQEVGGFDETLTTHEDWDLWIRLSNKYPLAHLKHLTAEFTWRTDGTSMTSRIAPDYVRTTEIIYGKYRSYAEAIPGVLAAQRRRLQSSQADTGGKAYTCSIIIPTFNRVELTVQCLTRLAEATRGIEYEVILVDNGSTDDTQALCDALSGDVQVIRNDENLGFAVACNQGAKAARGQYLVFLNNDTIPLDGWLGALVQEVQACPEVAVVGSKLLYQNGTIQHGGVAFSWLYGTAYHLYWGVQADAPLVNRRREFQAVTAACMLVRREAFEEVGGFDEGFRNGFEDMDLCLKIRDRGGRVVYQPKSTLYHLESQTPGRKTHERENLKRFLTRWRSHWWLSDEYMVYAEDGLACHMSKKDNTWSERVARFVDDAERIEWEYVAAVQRLTHRRDPAALEELKKKLAQIEAWPNDGQALRWGAYVCRHVGVPEYADTFWNRLLKMEEAAEARAALARHAIEQGRFSDAEVHIAALMNSEHDRGEGCLLRGVLDMQRQAYADAVTVFEASLEYGGHDRKARMGCGMAELAQGHADRAWAYFTEVLTTYPDDAEALHGVLRSGTTLQRWQDLSDTLQRFVQRNPADLSARYALSGVLLRVGNYDLARAQYDAVRLLNPAYDGLTDLAKALDERDACVMPHGR